MRPCEMFIFNPDYTLDEEDRWESCGWIASKQRIDDRLWSHAYDLMADDGHPMNENITGFYRLGNNGKSREFVIEVEMDPKIKIVKS